MRKALLLLSLLVAALQQVYSQPLSVTGKVTDKKGEPLIGVSVVIKGKTSGTTTDVNGNFKLTVPGSNSVLVFTYIGFKATEVAVGSKSSINVSLEEAGKTLNEVVVIGYGTVKRRDLTGSVASVTGEDIASTPVPNAAQAIQGKLPGVRVTAQDGRPGAEMSIRVRGGGSISQSNQPLILIDGVQGSNLADISGDQIESIDVLKDASSTAIYGARGANGVILVTTKSAKAGKTTVSYSGYVKFNEPTKYLQSLSPYDYLRYVWANAAANGTAFQTPFEKYYGLGANAGANTNGIESYRNLASDDIQKQVYNESTSWNHALTLTGGTDKTKILFSANYTDDQGMKINSYYKRANAVFKLNQKIFNNLTFDLNTRYSRTPTLGDEGTSSGGGSLLSTSYRFRPIATEHVLGDVNAVRTGNIEQYGKNSMWDAYSPVARISDYEPYNKSQNAIAITSLNWGIIKGLTYHTDFNLGGKWDDKKYWSGAVYKNYMEDATGTKLYAGDVDYRKTDNWNLRWTNTLNYEFDLNKFSKLNMLAGQEVANTGGTYLSVMASRFPANFSKEQAFGQINQYDPSGSSTIASNVEFPRRLRSYFGRANYSLLDKYLFTLTFRADASSTFGPSHKWGYFPAAAFAWRVSEEPFMKNIGWLDNLKIRASYGESGNDGIDASMFIQTWSSTTDQREQYALNHGRVAGYQVKSILANADLKWETTITRNLGTDFSLFKSKLAGTVDLYWNSTKDLLTEFPISGISGFTSTIENVGQTSNKGIELSLTGTVLKNKDWRITAGGNINFNKSNIDDLADGLTGLYGTNWNSSGTYPSSDYFLAEGKPVGMVRGLTYQGFYTPDDFNYNNGMYTLKQGVADLSTTILNVIHGLTPTNRPTGQIAYPGLPKFKDFDSNGIIDDKDLSVIGKMYPIHTGGFSLDAGYKNFDLGLNFNWSYGNEVYNVTKLATLFGPKEAGVYENKLAILNNAYKIYDVIDGKLLRLNTPDELNAANANATLPLAYSEGGPTSTLGIEDGSFLRLNTLTLGYRLPKSVVSKVGLGNVHLYSSVYNLLTITGYSGLDPEVSTSNKFNSQQFPTIGMDYGAYPRARSFVFGMNVNF